MAWHDLVLPSVEEIGNRLDALVPRPLDPNGYVRREIGAKTIFVLLYGDAIEGRDRWIRPTAVTYMTDEQVKVSNLEERRSWLDRVQSPKRPKTIPNRWYAENTREPIRDETLRKLVELGIVFERQGLPTTSPKPRYALRSHVLPLFDPALTGKKLEREIHRWQEEHVSMTELARIRLGRLDASGKAQDAVLVRLPNGEVRKLSSGPSSELSKSVVEVFAPRFLDEPAVISISESSRKIGFEDQNLSRVLGLDIDPSRTLPDIVLADLAKPPRIVFVECVVSDGPIHEARRRDLTKLAARGGHRPENLLFVTAFRDRSEPIFRKLSSSLAWNSFAWFAGEPENILFLRDKSSHASLAKLSDL